MHRLLLMNKNCLIDIFKLQLYFLRNTSVYPIPFFQNSSIFPTYLHTCLERTPKFVTGKFVSCVDLQSFFFLLYSLKLQFFRLNYNFSRFTTQRYRFLDRRFRRPKLAEFNFNLEEPNVLVFGLEKTKLAVNYHFDSISFFFHFFQKFSKSFFLQKLHPYEKLSTFILKKIAVKRLGLLSYATNPFVTFSRSFVFIHRFMFLFGRLTNVFACEINLLFLTSNTFNCALGFLPFIVICHLTKLPNVTGLIAFLKPNIDIVDPIFSGLKDVVGVVPIRHFDKYYPFSFNELALPGAKSIIPPKFIGKGTHIFFNTQKMLKRKPKNPIFFPDTASSRRFVNFPQKTINLVYRKLFLLSLREQAFNNAV